MGYPGFGPSLARLLEHRRMDGDALAHLAGVPETEVRSLLGGAQPSPESLDRLATALRWHTSDFFVIAGLSVPDDMAPLDTKAGKWAVELAAVALQLSQEARSHLRELIRSLPQKERVQPPPQLPQYEPDQTGFGPLAVRLLENRNLNLLGAAKTLARMSGLYVAASTIGMIAAARKEFTPALLTDFATVLDIPATDLAALAGMGLAPPTVPRDPAVTEVAELLWDVRRLTADQLQEIYRRAELMI